MRKASCALAAGLSFGLPARALAQTSPAPSYGAPVGCPAGDAFVQRYRARLGSRDRFAPGRSIDVRIVASGDRYVGKLSVLEDGGQSTTKTLSDRDCDALVDALALVAALIPPSVTSGTHSEVRARPDTQDPGLATIPPRDTSGTHSEVRTRLDTQDPALTSTPAPASAPAPASPPASGPTPASASASADSTASTSRSRLGVGLGGRAAFGPAPEPLLGPVIFVRWTAPGAGVFSPVLELGGGASLAAATSAANGTATFAWLTAHADAYLVRWAIGSRVLIRAGASGDFGALLASGQQTVSPASSSRPWASLGAAAELEVPLGTRWSLDAAVAVEAPLRRDRYAFGSRDFFEVPALVATSAISLVATVY